MKPKIIPFVAVYIMAFAAIQNSSAEHVEDPLGTDSVCTACENIVNDVVALRSAHCNLVKHPYDTQPKFTMSNDELFSFLMVVKTIASPENYQMVVDNASKNVDCDNTLNWISQIVKAA